MIKFTPIASLRLVAAAGVLLSSGTANAQQTLEMQLQPPGAGAPATREKVTLPSRGLPTRESTRSVTIGRVGIVRTDKASIHKSRQPGAAVLFTVKKGTPLAVTNTQGAWYGVLMVDGSTGWVGSEHLGISDLNVVSNGSSFSGSGEPLIQHALTYLGIPYVWGGNSRSGTDCSGFVKQVYNQFGIRLPRTAREQALVGESVSIDTLSPGDRLYFSFKGKYIDHTGIYIGNGSFVHSSSSRGGVGIDQLFTPRFQSTLICARRS